MRRGRCYQSLPSLLPCLLCLFNGHRIRSNSRRRTSHDSYGKPCFDTSKEKDFFLDGMTRNRKRKTTKGSFTEESMRIAVDLVVTEGFSIRQAAKQSGIKFSTLQRYVTKVKGKTEGETVEMVPNYACRQIFTADQEELLQDYLVQCSAMSYGKSTRDLREIAYEMAIINDIKVPDSWHRDKKAGVEWTRSFLKRNKLSLKTPEGCSLPPVTAFDKHNVDLSFLIPEILYEQEESFGNGTRVQNSDEIGTMTVQSGGKIIAKEA